VIYLGSPHTAAVLALIKTAWALVGDGVAPDGLTRDADGRLIQPYVVLYPLGTPRFDGSLGPGDEQSDAWPAVQLTSVGSSREQAEWMRDKTRTALLGQYLTVIGRRVGPLRLLDEQAVTRQDDVTPHLYFAVDRFRAFSTPS
jgi:hypothetical protein